MLGLQRFAGRLRDANDSCASIALLMLLAVGISALAAWFVVNVVDKSW